MKSFPNRYGHFVLKKLSFIEELQLTLIELEHEPTGAQVVHLANDDEENVFNISLRTYPESSNGAAHVLEHIVLCGSEKYPIKDPFFAMSRRSLNTFMNAFTGPDFTCYPAASQIPKDFYNLLEVYLDAVFHPRLREVSFLQEGHHLALNEKTLEMKGVVYNEMKGALANPDNRLEEALFASIFPDLPYRFNAGGDPVAIRGLTYADVCNFHKKYYHPSQALFYFYGNLPLEKHLDFLEKHLLHGVEKQERLPSLPPQPRFAKKQIKTLHYPFTEKGTAREKSMVALGWLVDTRDEEELLALDVLDMALMGTDAAPLRGALLKSNLCKQVDTSLEDELSEAAFFLICKGCAKESAEAIEHLVLKTFEKIAEETIPAHLIEGAIHQLEVARKEITGSSMPHGLNLFFRSAFLKQQGKNPEDGLKIHSLFKKLRALFADPQYAVNLIKRHFLNNTHCVRVAMHPDTALPAQELQEETNFAAQRNKSLSQKEKEKIVQSTTFLREYQEERENVELLPKLALEDIPLSVKDLELRQEAIGNLTLFSHSCFTNEILYADLIFDLPDIAEEDLSFLRLFSLLLAECGCGGRNYKDNLEYIFEYTGGVGCDLDLYLSALNPSTMQPALLLRGKALYQNVEKLFTLFQEMVKSVDFSDRERIEDLLRQHREELENSFERSPLRYALNLATSGFSKTHRINNLWYGLTYFENVKKIMEQFLLDPLPFQKKMEALQQKCLGVAGAHLVVTASEEMLATLRERRLFGLADLQTHSSVPWSGENIAVPAVASQGRIISAPVAFTAQAFRTVPYTHPLSSALSVGSQIMENRFLHKRIREQGGAYGAGATHASTWAYFYFHAYRDPHLKSTLAAFKEAAMGLSAGDFDANDLEEAKFSLLQMMDAPRPPGARASTAYAWLRTHRTHGRRQAYRTHLLGMTAQDVMQATREILLPGLNTSVVVSFAGKELLEKENILPILEI